MFHLWDKIDLLDGSITARRANCSFDPAAGRYIIKLLNSSYAVVPHQRTIRKIDETTESDADYLEQLCLLAYLIHARDIPVSGQLVNPESLPGGDFFFRGPHNLPIGKLAKAFCKTPDLLLNASKKFAARPETFGDASITLDVLPRIPITIIVWGDEEEFAGRVSILFDSTASEQMPLDALLAVADLTAQALIRGF